ncbi:MAG: hypothetical protein A3F41_00370 [Coxiella sp. RIFCSPHIGHO2_12_FULL_44_14]|nr:MAG: hypothetical protein A3F41_00370 [Coxiella sp. RIFCSPHIGHO2_12_FULL_44_14]
MKKILLLSTGSLGVLALMLSGCTSNNVPNFQPDAMQAYQITHTVSKGIVLGDFSMPAEKDKNHLLCRLSGNVYLPNKTTYSQYIKHAFATVLITANRYSVEKTAKTHTLSSDITSVNFDSLGGKWMISANMRVDHYPLVSISSSTRFGTAWNAGTACQNVAQGFETAVQDFISQTLNNPRIKRELNI